MPAEAYSRKISVLDSNKFLEEVLSQHLTVLFSPLCSGVHWCGNSSSCRKNSVLTWLPSLCASSIKKENKKSSKICIIFSFLLPPALLLLVMRRSSLRKSHTTRYVSSFHHTQLLWERAGYFSGSAPFEELHMDVSGCVKLILRSMVTQYWLWYSLVIWHSGSFGVRLSDDTVCLGNSQFLFQ